MDQSNAEPNVNFKFPKGFWMYLDTSEKDEVLQKIVQLWFKDQIAITEDGDLCYTKTGLNNLKKILLSVMTLADQAALAAEKNADTLGTLHAEAKAKSTKDRMKTAGLISLEPNLPKGNIIL